jgi:D-sedoheptulose 7-phosphate isomerase
MTLIPCTQVFGGRLGVGITLRMSIEPLFSRVIHDLAELLPKLEALHPQLQKLSDAMMKCWNNRGKILIAGNGGSSTDAMHFAEELVVRYQKNRRALAALALCDPSVITCAGNDFGYEQVFSRQIEALGNEGDIFIALSTSGNSPNILRAIQAARSQKLVTVTFLGKDGGKAKGLADIELIVPAQSSALIQAGHQIFYHTLCEWVDAQVT